MFRHIDKEEYVIAVDGLEAVAAEAHVESGLNNTENYSAPIEK